MRGAARFIAIVVGALALLACAWVAWIAAHVAWYRTHAPGETAFMAQRMSEARAKDPRAQIRYQWVPYSRISVHLKRAMIASEDAKFVEHGGFDWDGIEKAIEKNRKKGRVVSGGSTITQQLAKNLFLSPDKSYWRKAQEAVATVLIEAILPKQRTEPISIGEGVWRGGGWHLFAGAGTAAAQAARLAAMTPSPRVFERRPDSAYLDGRVATILARMPGAVVP
jgi:monofunctional biosynthetic peptidoglycan transglycosylase